MAFPGQDTDLSLEGRPGVAEPLAREQAQAEGGDTEEHRLVEGERRLLHEVAHLVLQGPEVNQSLVRIPIRDFD